LGADGRVRGIVRLDAITDEEFAEAFRRWPVSLRVIEAEDLSGAIYAAIEPGVVATSKGGYQAVRFTLKPQMTTVRAEPVWVAAPVQTTSALVIEPMPVLVLTELSGSEPPRSGGLSLSRLRRSGRLLDRAYPGFEVLLDDRAQPDKRIAVPDLDVRGRGRHGAGSRLRNSGWR
jgi:hypothetical protein